MCFFWLLKKIFTTRETHSKVFVERSSYTHGGVHALIERKRKITPNLTRLTPRDWQQLVRQKSNKYQVDNKEVEDFKNENKLDSPHRHQIKQIEVREKHRKFPNLPFENRKKTVNKEPDLLSTCVQLQDHQEQIGTLFWKSDFDGKAQKIDFVRF
nr:unnamed protein product [Callosobruchus chinensis]